MHWITSVEYVSDYKLRLRFGDSSLRLVDLAEELDGEVFEPLKDVRLFQTARLNLELDTVVWENGADMSPDFLYERGVPVASARKSVHRVAESQTRDGRSRRRRPPPDKL